MVSSIVFQSSWLVKINWIFVGTNSYLRMCWLKAIGGMDHLFEDARIYFAPLHFGLCLCVVEYMHYLICPMLWQLAREALNSGEANCEVGHRLCPTDCNHNRFNLVGYCHLSYHTIRKSTECYDCLGNIQDSQFVQNVAVASIRALKPLID